MTALLAAAILLLQLLGRALSSGNAVGCGGELPSGYVKYPGDNTAIKVYTEKLTWKEARYRCVLDGADLAVATTSEKVRFIQNGHDGYYPWIGIHRPTRVDEGDWIRIDTGQPISDHITSLPWKFYSDVSNRNCVATDVSGMISNWPCTYKRTFACEISLAEGKLPSGYVKYPGDNTATKVDREEVTWNKARDRCNAEGAHLAVATTSEKVRHLQNLYSGHGIWIGIHRPTGVRGGDWVRVDTGLPVTSLPWNDFSDSEYYDCVSVRSQIEGTITDISCIGVSAFACEISLAEDCPSPAPPGSKGVKGFLGANGSRGEEGKLEEGEFDGSPGIPGEEGSTGNAGAPGPRGSAAGLTAICIIVLLFIVHYAVDY